MSKASWQNHWNMAFNDRLHPEDAAAIKTYVKSRVPRSSDTDIIKAIDTMADSGVYNGDFKRPTMNQLCRAVRTLITGAVKPVYPHCDKCRRGWIYVEKPGRVDKVAVPCDCARGRRMEEMANSRREA